MRKLLIVLLVINIIALCFGFFMILANSLLYAIIFLGLGILELIPIIALISCLDNIEDLQYDNKYLHEKIRKLEDAINGNNLSENSEFTYTNNSEHIASGVWECIKCGTVNKANTSKCSNCNAPYSPSLNPTDKPYTKRKISRFVKFK